LLGEKNLNARACGLRRLDKDESVFVRNDHGVGLPALCRTTNERRLPLLQRSTVFGYAFEER
jgi:hypothetical protein